MLAQHSHFVVMYRGRQALLLGVLFLAIGATSSPSVTPAPSVTKTPGKRSCHARPPSCALLLTTETICAPFSNHKRSCFRFCRNLQFAYLKKARHCKSKDKTRFSTLFLSCMLKCAVVRRAAVAAARKGVPFNGVVTMADRLGRRRPLRGPGGRRACWLCRHHRTHCPRCCGSRWWCPRWA